MTARITRKIKREVKLAIGTLVSVASYCVFYRFTGVGFVCPWHALTGLNCPGCGLTRLLESLLFGDFYQAFRYNPLLFILLPFGICLGMDNILAAKRGRRKVIQRIPNAVWVGLVVVVVAYGLMRNLPWFSFLAPTEL